MELTLKALKACPKGAAAGQQDMLAIYTPQLSFPLAAEIQNARESLSLVPIEATAGWSQADPVQSKWPQSSNPTFL